MIEIRKPILVKTAVEKVLSYCRKGDVELIPIEQSYGRYLAEPLKADHDVPPFDKSPLDGFAIRSEDTQHASSNSPVLLEVIEEIGAGSVATKIPGPNQAIRIMTGAQIPEGTDAVVMFELTKELEMEGKRYIEIQHAFKSGDNISFQGEDTKKGEQLVTKGCRIDPGVTALLATFGYDHVPVYKKPVIGIFATGSELLTVGDPLQPGKIRNSNAYMIAAQIERLGAEPRHYGQLADHFDECYEAITQALEEVDLLITTGGVSVGDYDYLPDIYQKLGANVLFNKVAIRPGSVTTVAERNGQLLYGLSGNPSACFVGFEIFARPVILSYFEASRLHLQIEQAVLEQDFPKPDPFTRFVRGRVYFREGSLHAAPTGLDKSGAVISLAEANALIILPGGTRGYTAGAQVDVLLLQGEGSPVPWTD